MAISIVLLIFSIILIFERSIFYWFIMSLIHDLPHSLQLLQKPIEINTKACYMERSQIADSSPINSSLRSMYD
jgi:hypothetical protein